MWTLARTYMLNVAGFTKYLKNHNLWTILSFAAQLIQLVAIGWVKMVTWHCRRNGGTWWQILGSNPSPPDEMKISWEYFWSWIFRSIKFSTIFYAKSAILHKGVDTLPSVKSPLDIVLGEIPEKRHKDKSWLASVQGAPQIFGNWRQTALTLRSPIVWRIAEALNLINNMLMVSTSSAIIVTVASCWHSENHQYDEN